jgi:hypothetical protein
MMIGYLMNKGDKVAKLSDDGVWESDDKTLSNLLNVVFSPERPEVGDTHIPYGVGSLIRAGKALVLHPVLESEFEPLPDGAIS